MSAPQASLPLPAHLVGAQQARALSTQVDAPAPRTGYASASRFLNAWLLQRLCLVLALWLAPALVFASENVLEGRKPLRSFGVEGAKKLTDGVTARTGDYWKTQITARFRSSKAFVEYDLGTSQPLVAGFLQGDNDDTYVIEVSEDGKNYTTAWRAGLEPGAGMRNRANSGFEQPAHGRYVRISASGGDGAYSLSEVQLYSSLPTTFPPSLPSEEGTPLDAAVRDAIFLLSAAVIIWLLLAYQGAPWWWLGALSLLPAYTAYQFYISLTWAWPVEGRQVAMLRAAVALVGAVAILRESFAPKRFPAQRAFVITALAVCGAGSVAAFYNLGNFQFFDRKNQEHTLVHYWDARQYYASAKYFDELGYTRLYIASVAAYAEDNKLSLEALRQVELRDLNTHRIRLVSELRQDIEAVKQRFSPSRWEDFKKDMRFFWETMGPREFLDTMHDHGANATPVWMSLAYVLYQYGGSANNMVLLIGGLLDPLLLLGAFIWIGRAFGVRTALISLIIFGANDFVMFGSNWAGATLRHDWMAYLGLGACALKRQKWILAGALLGLASTIRAFPVLAIFGAIVPALWGAYDYWQKHKVRPTLATFRREYPHVEKILLGTALCAGIGFIVTSLRFSPSSWGIWLHKASLLNAEPHVNHIALRALVGGSEWDQPRVLQARLPLYAATLGLFLVAIVSSMRNKKPEQAAMIGLALIPVLTYPANYYIHFVFLLPLVISELPWGQGPLSKNDAWISTIWLGLCVAQYWTVLEDQLDLHFYYATVLLFVALGAMLALMLWQIYKPLLRNGKWRTGRTVPSAT